jgi:hypothetical protein
MGCKCFILFLGNGFFATFFLNGYPVIVKNDLSRDAPKEFQSFSQCFK